MNKCFLKFAGRAGKSRYWRCEKDHQHTMQDQITDQYLTSSSGGRVMVVLEVVRQSGYGMRGDPEDPQCRHGVWMVSQPGRSNYCAQCEHRDERDVANQESNRIIAERKAREG